MDMKPECGASVLTDTGLGVINRVSGITVTVAGHKRTDGKDIPWCEFYCSHSFEEDWNRSLHFFDMRGVI